MPPRSQRPLWTFLVVGAIAGTIIAVFVPRLAGIDEPYHYLRTWAIADFSLMPERNELPGHEEGGTICIPEHVLDDVFEQRVEYLDELLPEWDGSDPLKYAGPCDVGGEDGQRVDVATFAWYSPVGYAPQTIAVGAGRLFGVGLEVQLMLARFASLAAYLALCGLAIAMAPRARWALIAVALLPTSLFQAVTSLSPDGMTIAAVLLVVAGALRAADPTLELSRRRLVIEAALVCSLLALSKPTYIVIVAAYLIVFAGHADAKTSRFRNWPLLLPAAASVGLTVAWNGLFRDLFICDVRYFGVGTDPEGQISLIIRRPWELAQATATSITDHWRQWLTDSAVIGERVVPWGVAASAAVIGGFAILGFGPDQAEDSRRSELTPLQRIILVLVGIAAFCAVITGWIISCSPAGIFVDNAPHARLLVPAVVPILAGLSLPGRKRRRSRFPLGFVLLAAGYSVWLIAMIDRMG